MLIVWWWLVSGTNDYMNDSVVDIDICQCIVLQKMYVGCDVTGFYRSRRSTMI